AWVASTRCVVPPTNPGSPRPSCGGSPGVSVASFEELRDHPRFGQFMATFGATDAHDLRSKLADFNLDGAPERITCPTLILQGDSDVLVPVAAAHDVFGRLRGD